MFYYSIRLDFRNAFRRLNKNGIMAELNGKRFRRIISLQNILPKEICRFFTTEKIYTLGYNTPPPYLVGIYNRLKPVVKLFMKLDEILKGIFPVNRLGDHFIIVMMKK